MSQKSIQKAQKHGLSSYMSTFVEVSKKTAMASLDNTEALKSIANAALELVQCDVVGIIPYDESESLFHEGIINFGSDLWTRNARQRREDVLSDDAYSVLSQGIAVFSNHDDPSLQYSLSPFIASQKVGSSAIFPLVIDGSMGFPVIIGVMILAFHQPSSLTQEDHQTLHYLSSMAAISIGFEKSRRAATENERWARYGEIVAVLQHRVGNMVSVMLPAIGRLRLRVGSDQVVKRILDTMEQSSIYALDLLRRSTRSFIPNEYVLVSMYSLLDSVVDEIVSKGFFNHARLVRTPAEQETRIKDNTLTQQPTIIFVLNLPEDLPKISIDEKAIIEVFRILIENAMKSIVHDSGSIKIMGTVVHKGGLTYVRIIVSDSGHGIPDELRHRLFRQPIPRGQFSNSGGIGLWLSSIIVGRHQGAIGIISSHPEEGTSIFVDLPLFTKPDREDFEQPNN